MLEDVAADPTSVINRKITLNDLPAFMEYLSVSDDDKEFVENICGQLTVLLSEDKYVKEGLNFKELMDVLRGVHFM